MRKGNAVYAQSGGVSSVINASAYGVITEAMKSELIDQIYGGFQGINGILDEKLIDLHAESPATIEALRYTPAAALGSCRKKLPSLETNRAEYERIVEVFEAHNIRYFFYNGGNDSMDTAYKVSLIAEQLGYDVICVGIPKTVDNDLPMTDNSPGYGSVAKYNAISMLEGGFDVRSMYRDSTKVFVLETMGRHAGWIAGATALARANHGISPHIILLPEVTFDQSKFINEVEHCIGAYGYCTIAVSEGIKNEEGEFLSESGVTDAFGHAQLGGVGLMLQTMIKQLLHLKTHGALLDYCQRSGRHIASRVDVEQAVACGKAAVSLAEEGLNGKMITIVREGNDPYRWTTSYTDAANVANQEKTVPPEFIASNGMDVTEKFIEYCQPLIVGEEYPPYHSGVPQYGKLKQQLVSQKLSSFSVK